MLVTNFR